MIEIIAIVGNPPYQKNSYDKKHSVPIYNLFIDLCSIISDSSFLITPARFLFNIGQTPKKWNEKWLNSVHLRVVKYEENSTKIFSDVQVMGGLAILEINNAIEYQKIGFYIRNNILSDINDKVSNINKNHDRFDAIISSMGPYYFTDNVFNEFNIDMKDKNDYKIHTNAFDKFPFLFSDIITNDDSIGIYGRYNNKRVLKFINRKYIKNNKFLDTFNVLVPVVNGCTILSSDKMTPVIGTPILCKTNYCSTETFLSIGTFHEEKHATACMKYIKTKFMRTMLGMLKTTQSNTRNYWRFVPLQDFTPNSDIDWSKTIPEIDKQFYKKYGLSEEEINYIETHIQAME